MSANSCRALLAILVLVTFVFRIEAGTVWDGDGAADAKWTTAANWDSDTLPAFDGSMDLTIFTLNAAGTVTTLDGDKNINSLTTAPNRDYSINGNTLILQSGNISGNSNSREAIINSNVTLGANGTFDIAGGGAGQLTVNGDIGDSGSGFSLTKTGGRRLNLNGANTYTGQTILNGGALYVGGDVVSNVAGPLGKATSAVVLGQTSASVNLILPNAGQSFGRNIEISAAGSGDTKISGYGAGANTTISGNIAMNRDLTIYANSGPSNVLDITGIISGTGNLTTDRYVRFSQAHTYTGTTTIGIGGNYYASLAADAPNGAAGAFGNATSDVVIAAAGLNVEGAFTIGRNLSITGSVTLTQRGAGAGTYDGNIDMPNATTTSLSVLPASGSQVFNGIISGQGGLLRNGGQGRSTYINNPLNSYTGTTEIRIGDVIVGADAPSGGNGALGNSTSAVLFHQLNAAHDSSLRINGAFEIGRDIDIANAGTGDDTTLGGITADNSIFSGDISINAQSNALLTAVVGGQVTFSGDISGAGDVRKIDGGKVILSGGSSYTGTTTVSAGTLIVAANNALGGIGTGTVVNNGATLGFQGGVNYAAAEPLSVSGAGDSSQGAIRNLAGNNRFAGPITLLANTTFSADAGQLELAGLITDGASTFNFIKQGTGTISLTNASGNTYSGATTLLNGTLLANNTSGSATGSGPVFIGDGATLGGVGRIGGDVTALAGGSLAPGNSPGTLTLNGNLDFTDNTSKFVVELADSAADQLIVNGEVNLANATLDTTPFGTIAIDSKLFLLVNDDTDAITGTFDGLANGSTVNLGNLFSGAATAQISYFGDFSLGSITGGNDIVLYNFIGTQVPEPSSFLLLGFGLLSFRRLRRRK